MQNGVRVSVIVPVRDDPGGVRELLALLEDQTLPGDQFEVLIGDDGSRAGSLAGIATADGRIRVLAGPPRTSYAARNRAAQAAHGAVLAFCDADCRPVPEWLEEGLRAMEESDLAAGEVIFQAPPRPTVWSLLTADMFLDQRRNVQFSRAVTANLFVRRDLFSELGGFDDSLPSGGDYEFVRRAVSHGARLVHCPTAIIRHPTIDAGRRFLRKVWFTNRWSGARSARSGLKPGWAVLVEFAPILGVALARRHALRPVAALSRDRLAAAGLPTGWRSNLSGVALLYVLVAYVAGLGRSRGWLEMKRAMRRRGAIGSAAGARVGPPAGLGSARAGHASARIRQVPLRNGALPNLVVIGAQKCGTGALHEYLRLHPAVFMSRQKELDFFVPERNWSRGVGWYRRRFDPRYAVRGESSPNYTAWPRFDGVPERMRSVIPEAKLVFLVRDPIERMASHWLHNYAQGRERGDLRTTLHDPTTTYIARSCYFRQLSLFLDHFDESQILVLDASDLRLRRLYALRQVFAFLGIDPGFFHPAFDRTWHVSSPKRRATRLGQRVRRLSRTGAGRVVPAAVWRLLEAMPGLSHPLGPTPDLAEAIGPETMAVLREDAEQLRSHTGLPLSEWSVFADFRRPAYMGAAE